MDEQRAVTDHLCGVAAERQVDAVLVSGDVFDRAVPPPEAVQIWDRVQTRLVDDAGCRLIAISGNHDSPTRLGIGSRLLARAGVHIRTQALSVGEPVLLADGHGEVALYPIPYLEPTAAPTDWELAERSHTAALSAAMRRVRADLATRPEARSVVLAHAFVTGGTGCDSERDIGVGGVSNVPASVFDGIDYVALGHLHRPQALADHIRYSGSVLPYSFSEANQTKGCLLVELGRAGCSGVEFVASPPSRRLVNLVGGLEELLTAPQYEEYEDFYVRAVLTDTEQLWAPGDQLRRRFPHLLVLETPTLDPILPGHSLEDLQRLDPMQIAAEFVEHTLRRAPTPDETALLRRAFEQVRLADQETAETEA